MKLEIDGHVSVGFNDTDAHFLADVLEFHLILVRSDLNISSYSNIFSP